MSIGRYDLVGLVMSWRLGKFYVASETVGITSALRDVDMTVAVRAVTGKSSPLSSVTVTKALKE